MRMLESHVGLGKKLLYAIGALGASALLVGVSVTEVAAQGLIFDEADDGFFSGSPNIRAADGGLTLADVYDASGSSDGDNKWGFRDFATSATVITSANGPNASLEGMFEDSPEIVQSVDGLNPSTNYDIYVAYWSNATTQNWGVRAGLSSNPGGNQYFNRTGPIAQLPDAVGGTLASILLWDVLPPDNPSGTDDGLGVFDEGPRSMYLGFVGSAMPNASGEIEVFIDDLSPGQFGLTANHRSWFDGVAYVEAGTVLAPVLSIDRGTGNITLRNDMALGLTIAGYSVGSANGGLTPANWDRVADPDAWNIVSNTSTELSEAEDVGGDGGALLAPNGGTFNLGNIWKRTPYDDVVFSATLADQSVITPIIEYTGDPIPVGDFTGDAMITLVDFQVLLDNLYVDVSGLTIVEAYLRGDINGDLAVNQLDYLRFRDAFETFNGQGAFASAISSVPEPGSALMLAVAVAAWSPCRRRAVR